MPQPEMNVHDPSMQELLLQLVRRLTGSRAEIAEQQVMNQYPDYLVLLLRLEHPKLRLVVKLAGSASPMACAFDRTAMLHHLVATQTSVRVPEVLGFDISAKEYPWRYLVLTYIRGEQWHSLREKLSEQERSEAYRQLGDAVAQIHLIRFLAFGELLGDGRIAHPRPYLEALHARARLSIRQPHLYNLFTEVLDKYGNLFIDVREPRLTHEDLHGYNLLFHLRAGQWQLAALLDFDKAWAGHAEIDLARMEFWRGMTHQAFWQAYSGVHQIDTGYEQRRPIYQLLWCYEYAEPTVQHYEDTRRLCIQNGFPYLNTFEG